jgi:hypothetical protein
VLECQPGDLLRWEPDGTRDGEPEEAVLGDATRRPGV